MAQTNTNRSGPFDFVNLFKKIRIPTIFNCFKKVFIHEKQKVYFKTAVIYSYTIIPWCLNPGVNHKHDFAIKYFYDFNAIYDV